ncbi:AzlC family ABC transporter permease [Kitasatospora sp. RB6PN24]|uniref:AzlC family ABC transporter permease n=1 Tax=Kitasatospora humi TaxID=2893891 RepID=UPI001E50C5E7|nr:AzlC family ABC transporter permease [Kitasatospora humi]MCC9305799.1 AzlC family ABC transporter permease [Kitasatospora humi]
MRSIWRTLDPGILRGIALVCLSVGAIGVSYGAIAVTKGFPLWFPVLSALVVLAGASEFLFVGIIAAGGNPITAVLVGLLVNARHLPYGLALPPGVVRPGWQRFLATHLMNDESVVLALAEPDLPRQRAAYWTCGLGMLVCWPAGALVGALAGNFVHDTDALGLDAMFPAVILALILPAMKDLGVRHAALGGCVIALVSVPFTPPGLPELLALGAVALKLLPTRDDRTPRPEEAAP